MTDKGTPLSRPIGTAWCALYDCEVSFFIRTWGCGTRELVARYGEGYNGPWCPLVDGRRQFGAAIPPHRTDEDVMALLLTPPIMMKHGPTYPTWEAGARYFGREYLSWPKVVAGESAHVPQ